MKKFFLILSLLALMAAPAYAQAPTVRLWFAPTSGSINSIGDDIILLNDAGSFGTAGITVSGTFSGTLEVQCSQDRVTYQALQIKPTNTGTLATSITTPGMWTASVAGCVAVRVIAPATFDSGTANVVLVGSPSGGGLSSGGGVGGSGTEFAEDAAHASGDLGTLGLAVRNDAGTVLATTTLDYIPLTTDATGALRVTGGAGGTASNYGAAFPTAGTAAGFTDGTNMVAGRAVDADTGAGTFNTVAMNSVFRTSGTPVEAGTSANPWNVVFPSAQAVTQSGSWTVAFASPQAVTQSGTWNIGTLTTVTNPVAVTQSGTWTNNIGTFPDNEPFNVAQINGVTPLMGNGASGTGALRVTIANDSTGTIVATQGTAANLNAQVVGNVAVDGAVAGNPVQAAFRASTAVPTAVSADNDVQLGWVTRIGLFNAALRDLAGDSAMDETNNALRVNVVTGAGGGASIADDATFTVAVTSLTPVGGVYRTSLDAVDDGDAGVFAMTQRRALHGSIRRESDGAEWGIASTAPFAVRFSDGTSFLNLASDSTHDSAVSTTGPLQLLEAVSDISAQTPVADGDAVRQISDLNGRAINIVGCDRAAAIGGVTTITDGSSTAATGMGAQGASIFNEVRVVTIVNTSTIPVSVDMRDGTAGSVLWTFPVPAATGQTHGGVTMTFDVPRYGTSNTAIAFDPSASATSIIISASGCKVK